jgi:hypothetical protein
MTLKSLNVQVYRINNDLAELFFNPREVDLRVGETLTLRERETGRSVISQVIAFRSATYPSLLREQLETLIGPEALNSSLAGGIEQQVALAEELNGQADDLSNVKVALAKIRKTVPVSKHGRARWEQWDGWIPGRDVDVLSKGALISTTTRSSDATATSHSIGSPTGPRFKRLT